MSADIASFVFCVGVQKKHGGHVKKTKHSDAVRAVANSLSPFGLSILEQIAGWYSQHILGEIFQGTPGCPLAVTVPRSTHLTHLLPQPIPSEHITQSKNSHPNDPSHILTPPLAP